MSRLTTYNTYDGKKTATHYINSCADELIEIVSGMDGKWCFGTAIKRLAEYEDTGLTPQEIIELRDDATELFNENKELENLKLKYSMNWDALCDYLGDRIASDKDCENGCEYDLLKKVNEIKNYNGNYINEK